jgi:hypothetical protein
LDKIYIRKTAPNRAASLKKLREKTRGRAIVLIGIVDPVRVELHLAVVEVEVRRVAEVVIGIRIFALIHLFAPRI